MLACGVAAFTSGSNGSVPATSRYGAFLLVIKLFFEKVIKGLTAPEFKGRVIE